MEISERKFKILEAIIDGYIGTAEPIGSRTIETTYNIGISSATIRNEMKDLENMGLITQPHKSAGRIPSDTGYRLYVDTMLSNESFDVDKLDVIQSMISNNIGHINSLMEETAKMISAMTNYVTIISEPKAEIIKIKRIQIVYVDSDMVLLVIIFNNNKVKNRKITATCLISTLELYKITEDFNEIFANKEISEIDREKVNDMLNKWEKYFDLLVNVIDVIVEEVNKEGEYNVYTSGTDKILNLPEFSDVQKATEIFMKLQQKDMIVELLSDSNEDIQVVIGSENKVEQMQDFSIVQASYDVGKQGTGRIMVIGPKRMEYKNTIEAINSVVSHFKNLIDKE